MSVQLSQIPKKNIIILVSVSAVCSIFIISSYFLWNLFRPDFDRSTYPLFLILSIVFSVFSLGVTLLILKLKEIKPMYIPTTIWISLLIIYALISNIIFIIIPALVQMVVDVWFYKEIEKIS